MLFQERGDFPHALDWLAGILALDGSKLQAFVYDGKSRLLEIEFRVTAPYTPGEIPAAASATGHSILRRTALHLYDWTP